ncbi:conserved hypothetical protein [Gluconacetobacter diazotrophicus PA1 5]|uniref:Lipoprotein n=2 Tax=Gluconacetobacter diazotrophicus TaxID=33996 RepID=A0A7W4I7D6_GLUDI|nr:hypothetical protein [Gluconacetobacter diazotrophicus]ACI52005.1 conserved hypothetical protein [Gluconacetobacter diazotrophicus PA1 5]MBB2157645.1 hypothetical protein [Gluconacetobacter diazotrophicus]TWB05198.1 hypothetical protein FBZ86_11727 [Gluconacetobacter diazotrophicus]CAP54123.1 putative membrane protein [Gluconacetobacter diazotrophicus PA1 5]
MGRRIFRAGRISCYERRLSRREASLFQTIRLLGLAALLLSVAACGGGGRKKHPMTQKEVWQSMGFESGLQKSSP